MQKLTNQQMAFVQHYLATWNASEAARRAGYSEKTAYSQGPRLLKNVEVDAEIKARLEELKMGKDEVVVRLTEHGRATIEDFGDIGKQGSFIMDLGKAARLGKLGNVKKLKLTKYGYEIELHDAQAALEKLGKAHGIFVDHVKTEHSGLDGGPLVIREVVVERPSSDDRPVEG